LVVARARDVERRDAQALEREQLARLALSVLIEIAPHAKIRPVRVENVDPSVAVGVFLCERVEAVGRIAAGSERRRIAEQLAARVDGTVAVAVEDQEAVVGLDPPRRGLIAIAMVIEIDGMGGVDAHSLETVTVQIEHQRIARRRKYERGAAVESGR